MYGRSKKDTKAVYISLLCAMVAGRGVWGVVSFVLYGIMGNVLTKEIFMAEAIVNAVPGIVFQLVAIPLLVSALRRTKVIK